MSWKNGRNKGMTRSRNEKQDHDYDSFDDDDYDSIEQGRSRIRNSLVSRSSEESDEANQAFGGREDSRKSSIRSSYSPKVSLTPTVEDLEDEEESDECRAQVLVRCPIVMTSEEDNPPEPVPPMLTIRLTGSRYRKDIELNLDKEMDDVVYRILKSMDEKNVDLNHLRLSAKKRPFGFLQHCLAPLASCFSVKPPVGKSRDRRKNSLCPCRTFRQSRPRRSYNSPDRNHNMRESIGDESSKEELPRRSTHHEKRRNRKKSCCRKILKRCRKTLLCSRSCCLNDDVVLIEIVPSRAAQTDVKYKKHKERGVGTETSPELEILLNGDERCVAKKSGKKCVCRICCPKSKKKCKPKNLHEEPIKEVSEEYQPIEKKTSNESWDTAESRGSWESGRKKSKNIDRGKMSFERTYSLLVNSNSIPMQDSDFTSTSAPGSSQTPPWSRGRQNILLLPHHGSKSEPLNIYSALQQRFMDLVRVENLKRPFKVANKQRQFDKMYSPIVDKVKPTSYATSGKRKISSRLFFGRDYILELHETSESVEKTVKTQNAKLQTICITDYLRLHRLFQRSRLSMTSSATRAVTSTPSESESREHEKTMKLAIRKSETTNSVIVLKNVCSPHIVDEADCHNKAFNEHHNAPDKRTLQLESSKLLFMKFPPAKKSTNLLAFLKNLHSNKKLPKLEETKMYNKNARPKKSFTQQCVRNFEKLKIYLGKTEKGKQKMFLPVLLDRKRGMINLSSLTNKSS